MIDLREVRSVTEFQRNLKEYAVALKEKKTPLVLTVNGRLARGLDRWEGPAVGNGWSCCPPQAPQGRGTGLAP